MKILKNNYSPLIITCENCGSVLEINPSETHVGCFGQKKVKCPCCNKDTYIEELDDEDLTANNFVFPDHFYHFKGNYRPTPEEVERRLREGIKYLQKYQNETFCDVSLGSYFIAVMRWEDDELRMLVAKSYYDLSIKDETNKFEWGQGVIIANGGSNGKETT